MKRIVPLFFIIIITCVLLARLHMGLTRSFDPDEFTHLHFSYLMSIGKIPYRDFYHVYPPVFHMFLLPLFLVPEGPSIALAGRLVAFLLFLGITSLVMLLSYRITKSSIAMMLSGLFISTFPMIMDKTIEVRPDILMMLLFLLSLLAISQKKYVYAGIALSTSLLIVPKIIFAFPSLVAYSIMLIPQSKRSFPTIVLILRNFMLGGLIPLCILAWWLFINHGLWNAYDLLTRGVLIYTAMDTGSFSLFSALSPWPLIYTNAGGYSIPFLINCFVWICALTSIPFVIRKQMPFGIMTLLFFIGGLLSLILFQRPHLQYFIPLAVMGSLIGGVWIEHLCSILFKKRSYIYISVILLSIVLTISFFIQYQDRFMWNNEEQLEVLRQVSTVIPKNEPVYDMVGSFIFRPDAFPWTTNMYGNYAYAIYPNLKPLQTFLLDRQVKYIVLDQKGFVFWTPLPHDLSFITTHYLPSTHFKIYTPGVSFSCVNSICVQKNVHGNPTGLPTQSLHLHIQTDYRLTTTPSNQSVSIQGNTYRDEEIISLSPGDYTFSVPWNLSGFTLQMIDQKP